MCFVFTSSANSIDITISNSNSDAVFSNRAVVNWLPDNQHTHFLEKLGRQYVWFENVTPTVTGMELYKLLFDLGWLDYIDIKTSSAKHLLELDAKLTLGMFKLIELSAHSDGTKVDSEQLLISAVEQNKEDELLWSIIPDYVQVGLLRDYIERFRQLDKKQWPQVDDNFYPKLGQSHGKVKAIRQILLYLGDLPKEAQTRQRQDIFDSVVIAALKKFQQRHGLTIDGRLGPKTYEQLQITPGQRLKQLQMNLWRWFTYPKSEPERYILVNIPSYTLFMMESGNHEFDMKVVVGKRDNQTPLMITEINRLTVNPTWTPTWNIIKTQLIPEYEKDYLSLHRQNFQLLTGPIKAPQVKQIDKPDIDIAQMLQQYRLVQSPGDNNALGYYRFNIPNEYAIYLHDTPAKYAFNQQNRALSYGCVRLENASFLAQRISQYDDNITDDNIFNALQSGNTSHFRLHTPIPVFITYKTAWVNEKGELQFFPDVYRKDRNFEVHIPRFVYRDDTLSKL
ncbi:L,D-transpeptidase family protein [Thalassotalea ponticola]|uniref:L,D-transpeptidase family protein n=1 Tax=Thalassotalea ponticola TaxID=1523392 RepID=UPI003527BFAA